MLIECVPRLFGKPRAASSMPTSKCGICSWFPRVSSIPSPFCNHKRPGLTTRKAQARFPFKPVFGLSFEICRVSSSVTVSGSSWSCRSTFAVRQTRHSPCGRRAQNLHRHPAKGGGSSLVRRIDVIVALSSASLRPVVYRRSLVTL